MNDLTQTESRLRSWKPRPPSADLKARIFGAATATEAALVTSDDTRTSRSAIPAWQWLAPAMAVFMVAVMSWNDPETSGLVSGGSFGTSSSDFAAYSSKMIQHNVWPIATCGRNLGENYALSADSPRSVAGQKSLTFAWSTQRQSVTTPAHALTNSTLPQ